MKILVLFAHPKLPGDQQDGAPSGNHAREAPDRTRE